LVTVAQNDEILNARRPDRKTPKRHHSNRTDRSLSGGVTSADCSIHLIP